MKIFSCSRPSTSEHPVALLPAAGKQNSRSLLRSTRTLGTSHFCSVGCVKGISAAPLGCVKETNPRLVIAAVGHPLLPTTGREREQKLAALRAGGGGLLLRGTPDLRRGANTLALLVAERARSASGRAGYRVSPLGISGHPGYILAARVPRVPRVSGGPPGIYPRYLPWGVPWVSRVPRVPRVPRVYNCAWV